MIGVRTPVGPEEVRFAAGHVLFVEGRGDDAIDPTVLRVLLGNQLRIEPLGASFSVTSVAEALHQFHPNYYFLVDRDHHDCDFVEQCWSNFPDAGTRNLLVWRRREIENYFLDPDYLARSKYLVGEARLLRERILQRAQRRLYLDAANWVVVSVREALKRNRIQMFTDPELFSTRDQALQALSDARLSERYREVVSQKLSNESVERAFLDTLRIMTGETTETSPRDRLRFGTGKWIEMMRGKKLLAEILSSNLFRVEDRDGNIVSGAQERNEITRDLLQRDEAVQPPDFSELKRIIKRRIDAR